MDLYDPDWIKGLASRMGLLEKDMTQEEITLICELFKDYYHEGISAKDALEKSIAIVRQFRNKKRIRQVE
jgi:acyl-[acyl carrier protein]--UDP-N-acetylglucosamine O-acyltransferase